MDAARVLVRAGYYFLALATLSHPAIAYAQPSQQADVTIWARTQLTDTSFIRRNVALERLQKSPPQQRKEASLLFARALSDSSPTVRARALTGLRALDADAAPALGILLEIASDARDPLQGQAVGALASIGAPARRAVDILRSLDTAGAYAIRLQAATVMVQLGDTSAGITALRRLMSSPANGAIVLQAARALAGLGDSLAVPALIRFLADSSFVTRTSAIAALGTLGPKASSAIPALSTLLADTVPRRVAQGQASETEKDAAFAAWALARIIPFRSVASNTVLDPVYVSVADEPFSLRSDGLGLYAWGVDSVRAWVGSGLFLHLSPPSPARGPLGPLREGFRRSLAFDLSKPVAGSGAAPRGVVRDNEAYIWIWYRRDPATDRIATVREIVPSDSVHRAERVEMHFRIDGVLHILQMGPFVEGQGGASAWFTGMHGDGTSTSQLTHPSPDVWIVTTPHGSLARLWSFEDRARPLDRGLYEFSLSMRFMMLPSGAMGSCVSSGNCPWIRHE